MSQGFVNRRRHERVSAVQALFIEVVGRRSRHESENAVIRCETVDVSVGGLQIFVPVAIEAGTRLNIAVPSSDWKDNLELMGKAVWSRPAESREGFWVGLHLEDSSRDNMERWCQVVYRLSSK